MKKNIFFLTLLLLFCGFSAKADDRVQLRIFEEPKNKAWWSRTEFLAAGSSIREIPVHQIDPTWHYASELIKDAISRGSREFIVGIGGSATNEAGLGMLRGLGFRFLDTQGNEITDETEITFSRSGDFNNDGIDDLALVGVYEDCNLQAGRFFLILTKNKLNKWEVSFLKLLGEPKFLAISAKDAV